MLAIIRITEARTAELGHELPVTELKSDFMKAIRDCPAGDRTIQKYAKVL